MNGSRSVLGQLLHVRAEHDRREELARVLGLRGAGASQHSRRGEARGEQALARDRAGPA
jgi:hypothetical protein